MRFQLKSSIHWLIACQLFAERLVHSMNNGQQQQMVCKMYPHSNTFWVLHHSLMSGPIISLMLDKLSIWCTPTHTHTHTDTCKLIHIYTIHLPPTSTVSLSFYGRMNVYKIYKRTYKLYNIVYINSTLRCRSVFSRCFSLLCVNVNVFQQKMVAEKCETVEPFWLIFITAKNK